MKLLSLAASLGALAGAQEADIIVRDRLVADRKSFEDFAGTYGGQRSRYTEQEKEWAKRIQQFLITVLSLEHVDSYTPSVSHPLSDQKRGNTDPSITRHGRVVELELNGRGWDTSYENFFREDPADSNDKWNLGIRFEVNTEFNLAWRLPIYMNIHEDISMFEFAPLLNLDLNAWASMEIHLWFINLVFSTWFQPYTFTPFDTAVKVDPVKPQRYCHGIDYYGEALVFEINYEQEVNECHLGLFGWLFPLETHGNQIENLDCEWRYYRLETPLFKTQITQTGDFYGPYYNYRCMAWHSADWEDWPLSQQTVMTARAERLANARN